MTTILDKLRRGSAASDSASPTPSDERGNMKLTQEDKKARKREQDRQCQRRKRAKDRENVRRLEARLKGLQNSNDSKVVLDMILKQERSQAKIDRQIARLKQLRKVVEAGLEELAEDGTASVDDQEHGDTQIDEQGRPQSQPRSHPQTLPERQQEHVPKTTLPDHLFAPEKTLPNREVHASFSDSTIDMPVPCYNTTAPVFHEIPTSIAFETPPFITDASGSGGLQDPISPPETVTPASYSSPWVIAGQVVEDACTRVRHLHSPQAETADSIDQHVILTVVLNGWDCAQATMLLDPSWTCLRQVDEAVTGIWNKVERLVALYLIRRVMKAHAKGPEAVAQMTPTFIRPRPSQLHIPHRPDIDQIPWPGMRERLVFDSNKYYSSEAFHRMFTHSFCFVWPFSLYDTFVAGKRSQLMQFSSELLRRFNNLNYWVMDGALLKHFPEFAGDVPAYNTIPPSIQVTLPGGQYFHFGDEGNEYANNSSV